MVHQNTVNNAVKYADYALGRFFEMARKSPYWDDTVFIVVADHNSRVYGNELVPVSRFRIPALILGGSVSPSVFDPVAILQKDRPITEYTYEAGRLSKANNETPGLAAKALAHASWSSMAYEKALYRLPLESDNQAGISEGI